MLKLITCMQMTDDSWGIVQVGTNSCSLFKCRNSVFTLMVLSRPRKDLIVAKRHLPRGGGGDWLGLKCSPRAASVWEWVRRTANWRAPLSLAACGPLPLARMAIWWRNLATDRAGRLFHPPTLRSTIYSYLIAFVPMLLCWTYCCSNASALFIVPWDV
jgi:hypothetical protein